MSNIIAFPHHEVPDRCPYCNGNYICAGCGEPLISETDILNYIQRLWKRGSRVYGTHLARRFGLTTRTMYRYLDGLVERGHLVKIPGKYGYHPPPLKKAA